MALQEVKDLEKRVAMLEKKAGVAQEPAKVESKVDEKTGGKKPQAGG